MATPSGTIVAASSTPSPPPPRRRVDFLVFTLLAALALAAYAGTFSAPFVGDDEGAILENPTLRGPLWRALLPPPGGLTTSGRPIANLSLALNHAVSGEAVWSYHTLNLLIHLLAACTLYAVLRRTLASPRLAARFGGAARPLAATIAALWLLHPVQTEAVTYVCQRTESLAGLWILLALYAFIRATTSAQPVRWHALTVGAALAGVGTKEIAVALPPLLLLYDRTFVASSLAAAWRARRGLHLALFATWLPLLALVATTGWNRGGTAGFDVTVAPTAYWLTQPQALTHYLRLIVWPHPLVFDHGTFWGSVRAAAPYAALIVPLLGLTLHGLWRGTAAGFLGAWCLLILAPTSLVPGTIQMIVEHRLYLPLAALLTLLVTGAYAALGRRSLFVWPAVALALGGLTLARNATYRSAQTLWEDTVARAPANARARYNLGLVYSAAGRPADAVAQGEAALRLADPRSYAAKAHALHNKLGFDLMQLGRTPEAIAHYETALRLRPDYALAHLNLARALSAERRFAAAVPHYEAALTLAETRVAVESELALALFQAGRLPEALAHAQAVVTQAPRSVPAYCNLGYLLLSAHRPAAAAAAFRRALELDPADAAARRGAALATGER
ncbi:tetratricopeptide repeat protein [Opitutus sp. ER46]|uniref:tetratricopeptide repeat protein n=1 Tax=Opitutus sp. ER46 TaxID=2161864 RepID=UPI001304B843|nr:tetratricopeptide repeat protein [Opitutus sp. ER46]